MVKFKETEQDKGTGEGERRCLPGGVGLLCLALSTGKCGSGSGCVLCLSSEAQLGSRAVGLGLWAHSSSLVSTVFTACSLESSV